MMVMMMMMVMMIGYDNNEDDDEDGNDHNYNGMYNNDKYHTTNCHVVDTRFHAIRPSRARFDNNIHEACKTTQ